MPIQCVDKLYGPEFSSPLSEDGSSDEDVASVLAREVADLKGKQQKERRFQSVVSGAKHVVFIACSPSVQPCELVHTLLSDVLAGGQRISRYCQRMLPVVNVCRANISDISKHARIILEPHFHSDHDKIIKVCLCTLCACYSKIRIYIYYTMQIKKMDKLSGTEIFFSRTISTSV